MSRKVIIDCDPGIDDAVALAVALGDPQLEVLAVTATSGTVSAQQANINVQSLVERLDPARRPRLGFAVDHVDMPGLNRRNIHGEDGLGGAAIPTSQLHNQHAADKVISDIIRANPEEVTIVALGPLTNIARAFSRDAELPRLVNRLVMMGGAVGGVGNVTPAAEFNIYYNPASAREVFQSATTKTLIPLDVTRQVVLTLDFLSELPEGPSPVSGMYRRMLSHLFRSFRQVLGLEGIYLHDAVAMVAAAHPELFETVGMAGDVETSGELTAGVTVFDRRQERQWKQNMEVATTVDTPAVVDCLVRGLKEACRK